MAGATQHCNFCTHPFRVAEHGAHSANRHFSATSSPHLNLASYGRRELIFLRAARLYLKNFLKEVFFTQFLKFCILFFYLLAVFSPYHQLFFQVKQNQEGSAGRLFRKLGQFQLSREFGKFLPRHYFQS